MIEDEDVGWVCLLKLIEFILIDDCMDKLNIKYKI